MRRRAQSVPRILWEGFIAKQLYRLVATCHVREPYPVVDRAERDTMYRRQWLRDSADYYPGASLDERLNKCGEVRRIAVSRALAHLAGVRGRR